MQIQKNVSLKNYNTFGIAAKALHFISVTTESELKEALSLEDFDKKFILGSGSNMLLKKDLDELVIHVDLKGIEIVKETSDHIWVKVAAGENWHQFVRYCVDHDYGGIENLSLIPGNTGTAPVQNIGAYGVELKDVFHEAEAIHRTTLEKKTFSLEESQFGYRDSVFKNKFRDQYVIVSVTFRLTRKNHTLHTGYGDIRKTLEERGIKNPTIRDISDAVSFIRSQKLPDPKILGNSGSFFKNPVISAEEFEKLKAAFPEIPSYPAGVNQVKVPAGWLIENAGLKGKRYGDAGIHEKQALVLVNYGNATGQEIWEVAMKIQAEVNQKFGIWLEPEVNIID